MAKRIIATFTCAHAGKKLPPVVVKDWDTCPTIGRVCFCMTDPEKNLPMATPMNFTVEVVDSKPE